MSITTNSSADISLYSKASIGESFFLSVKLNIIERVLSLYALPLSNSLNTSFSIHNADYIRKSVFKSNIPIFYNF